MVHETRLRVRFDEVDSMAIVHHPRYLVWFEVARTEFFRSLGSAYRELMESGTHLAIVEAGVRYVRSARYDDEVTVSTRCTEVGGASVMIRYAVHRGGDLLATGFTRLGAVTPEGRAKRLPTDLRARFEGAVQPGADDTRGPDVQEDS